MFLRCNRRSKDGKEHRYCRVVENRRLQCAKVAQRSVLYRGEINDSQRAAWRKSRAVFDESAPRYTTLSQRRPGRSDRALAHESAAGRLHHGGDAFLVNVESDIVKFVHCSAPGWFLSRALTRSSQFATRRSFPSRPYALKQSTSRRSKLFEIRRAVDSAWVQGSEGGIFAAAPGSK